MRTAPSFSSTVGRVRATRPRTLSWISSGSPDVSSIWVNFPASPLEGIANVRVRRPEPSGRTRISSRIFMQPQSEAGISRVARIHRFTIGPSGSQIRREQPAQSVPQLDGGRAAVHLLHRHGTGGADLG